MTVRELIEALSDMDPDAEVRMMEQPDWPFEYSIRNVVKRGDIEDGECRNDVLLIEGRQLKYGNREAWNTCRR